MDIDRLWDIVDGCSWLTDGSDVVPTVLGSETFDMVLCQVCVDREAAISHREELVEILNQYPELRDGPSYIEVGAVVGDQGIAFGLFAIGAVLGFWKVVTPRTLGIEEKAIELAGRGLVMITGYKP